MTSVNFKEFLYAQCKEIEKYKWYLGVQLHHDPLLDRTIEDIGCEWIQLFAADYRKYWEEKNKKQID
jgi:hypothetical protein